MGTRPLPYRDEDRQAGSRSHRWKWSECGAEKRQEVSMAPTPSAFGKEPQVSMGLSRQAS